MDSLSFGSGDAAGEDETRGRTSIEIGCVSSSSREAAAFAAVISRYRFLSASSGTRLANEAVDFLSALDASQDNAANVRSARTTIDATAMRAFFMEHL
jgi:hypothetical protein